MFAAVGSSPLGTSSVILTPSDVTITAPAITDTIVNLVQSDSFSRVRVSILPEDRSRVIALVS